MHELIFTLWLEYAINKCSYDDAKSYKKCILVGFNAVLALALQQNCLNYMY